MHPVNEGVFLILLLKRKLFLQSQFIRHCCFSKTELSQDDCMLNIASVVKVMSGNKKKYRHHAHLMDKT